MLVLTRRVGDAIVISDTEVPPRFRPIRIAINDVDRNKVRVGIVADPVLHILREELLEQGEKKQG